MQKRITYEDGIAALTRAATAVGGTLEKGTFNHRIVLGDVRLDVDLRSWDGSRRDGMIEAALISAGPVTQPGYTYSRIFSRRVAVKTGGLSVTRLIVAINKCLVARGKGKALESVRNAREDAQDAKRDTVTEKLLESDHFENVPFWPSDVNSPTQVQCILPEVSRFTSDVDGTVTITLTASPERVISILNSIKATA